MNTPAKSEKDRVVIFDTTLRDGEQCPGATMTHEEKLEVAELLDQMGVDIIEAGFPVASEGDFAAVNEIAKRTKNAVVCGLSRAAFKDIDRCAEAIKPAKRSRIHTFLSTSPVHMKYKLQKEPHEVYEMVIAQVTRARNYTDDVEWSSEDGTRTEHDFLCRCVEAAINAGATTINIPDTVGYAVPEQYAGAIRYLKQNVRGIDNIVISVHCHNDLGLAVSNSLAALKEGARQVECTINGLGERAGNCSLEEVVMAVRTRNDYFNLDVGIHTKRLLPTSRLVSRVTGIHVQRNKAIVGQNAFAHEAGIHQDGMLKHANTYEIMRPEDVGVSRTDLVLGKHSGRHALSQRIRDLGYHLDNAQLQKVFDDFKVLADRKKTIYDADIEALAESVLHFGPAVWTLEAVSCTGGSATVPVAAVVLWYKDGTLHREAGTGDGPIDAVFKTIERITGIDVKLRQFSITSVTEDEDAQGEAQVEAEFHGRILRGRAVSTDIIEASALAFLQVINRALLREQLKMNPQTEEVSVT
jgi:2-isopropylmalate synthase